MIKNSDKYFLLHIIWVKQEIIIAWKFNFLFNIPTKIQFRDICDNDWNICRSDIDIFQNCFHLSSISYFDKFIFFPGKIENTVTDNFRFQFKSHGQLKPILFERGMQYTSLAAMQVILKWITKLFSNKNKNCWCYLNGQY